ncbi:LysR family transcriptional regulator [Jeongeupia wiesaeckerbachi]|uniref:LysR family transcriptional regulator n=1 Tax=Jeongeupia wiesaeckerbachi TaxID=3051218 RepID=UPI003D800FFD
MLTFTQLEVFSRLAELRGFTAAATDLGISQSAVSHAIRALEQELGVALVLRQQSPLELTDAGEKLLRHAREILGLVATMRQEASDARAMKQGCLRIGSFGPSSSLRLIPDMLNEYRRRYPGVEVHIDEGPDRQVMQWLLDRRIDIGFVVLLEERFDTYPLVCDQLLAVVPAGHALAGQEAISLRELCDDPFILTEAGSTELVLQLFQQARLTPNIRYRSAQLMSILEMVARGDGVTILAELALPQAMAGLSGYVCRPLSPKAERHIGLAVLDERNLSATALAFIKMARSGGTRGS